MVLQGSKAMQGQLAPPVLWLPKDRLGPRELLGRGERLASPGPPGPMVLGEKQALQGSLDHKDLRGRTEAQGQWWRRAAPPRWLGFQAHQDLEGSRVKRGQRGRRERTDLQDLPAVTGLMAHLGSLGVLESQELRERQEPQGSLDCRDHRGQMGPWECPTYMSGPMIVETEATTSSSW